MDKIVDKFIGRLPKNSRVGFIGIGHSCSIHKWPEKVHVIDADHLLEENTLKEPFVFNGMPVHINRFDLPSSGQEKRRERRARERNQK